jgi:hypothetical protein
VREIYEESGIRVLVSYLGQGYLLMDRCKNPDYLFFAIEDPQISEIKGFQPISEFPVVKIPRLDFGKILANDEFKQLGALSIISLIDTIYDVRFLTDPRSSLIQKGLLK